MKYSPQKGLGFPPNQMPTSILIHGAHEFHRTLKLNEIFEKNPQLNKDQKKLIPESTVLSDGLSLEILLSSTDMFQGPQHVIIQNATDKMHKLCENIGAENTPIFFLLSRDYLSPSSKLRQLYESREDYLCIPCYDLTASELSNLVKGFFKKNEKNIAPDLVRDLSSFLVESPHTIEVELEKILTIAGDQPEITYEDIKATLVSSKVSEVRDFVEAFMNQNKKKFATLLKTLEDTNLIPALRTLYGSLLRLHAIKSHITQGASFDEAIKNVRPPVFFKEKNTVKTQLHTWTLQELEGAIERTRKLEVDVKKSTVGVKERFAVTLTQSLV